MATRDILIPVELCHTHASSASSGLVTLTLPLPAFLLMKELRRKSPSSPHSTTEVSGAITHYVYCQDLQETVKLKKKLEKGNRRGTSVSLLIARAAHEARLSCWRISLRIGLTFGTRHVLLVLCPSGSEQLPSAARSPRDKRLSEVQNYKFILDLSDLLLMSTNMLESLSGPSRTVPELIQSLVYGIWRWLLLTPQSQSLQ